MSPPARRDRRSREAATAAGHGASPLLLDLLAARYLKDPTFFWRICDSNNAPSPDALAASDLIGIPRGPATS